MLKEEILTLCKKHDEIKNSNIRLQSIEGKIFSSFSKNRYYQLIKEFVLSINDFVNKYKNVKEVEKALKWSKENNCNIHEMLDNIEDCYAKYDNDEFIAALDFIVLSKMHYLVEQIYYQINNKFYTKDFEERLR